MASNGQSQQSHSSPTMFPKFRLLPAELRIEVWKASFMHRVVVLHSSPRCIMPSPNNHEHWISHCNNPPALSVCFESRALALARYPVILHVRYLGRCTHQSRVLYLDPSGDFLGLLVDGLNNANLEYLFQTVRMQDPAGLGLRHFGAAAGANSTIDTNVLTLLASNQVAVLNDLEDLVLLVYINEPEDRILSLFRDGECTLSEASSV
ncbi:hypothetical protein M426DRAFT_16252 [Hypoxylon sp. CI-4A]|nr:hypothetical protein M426DRAFT_16252 [Hypoxylon sp. CI-4A]